LGIARSYGVGFRTNLAATVVETGRWDEAAAVLEELSPNVGQGVEWAHYHLVAARLGVRRGDGDGLRLIDRVLEYADRSPEVEYAAAVFETQIEAHLYGRRPDAASEAAREGIARVRGRDDSMSDSLLGLIAFAAAAEAERAAAAAVKGDGAALDDARQVAADYRRRLEALARDRAQDDGDVTRYAAWAAAEYSRIDGPPNPEAWASVRSAWTDVGRPYFAAYAGFREAEAALEAHRPKAEAVTVLREAHAITARLGARPLLAWIESLAARARIDLNASKDPTSTRPAAEGGDTPAAAELALKRFGLTRREREILALLAAGWTNRRIADSLFISENTAGVHVSNILGKLGVSNRVEAATLAARLGLDPQGDVDAARPRQPN
jgi:DNA-binding CsgD family transcriptional regulator